MAKVSVKGVLIGGMVDILASFFLAFVVTIFLWSWLGFQHTSNSEMHSAITRIHGSLLVRSMELVVSFGCTVLGGYISAAIARNNFLLNGTLASAACVAMGTYFIYAGIDHHSPIVRVALLASSPVMGLLGGYIKAQQMRSSIV